MKSLRPSQLVFNRNIFIDKITTQDHWDLIIIGGGATGLGIAVDSASRGYKTLLLERDDFAKGTSSRSTKLVHGGVRYLAKGDIRLVYDALRERGILLRNAAHLVSRQSFVIPCYSNFDKYKYLLGLKVYDWLSVRYSFGQSRLLSPIEVIEKIPHINPENLEGGIEYYDGQFDDARLAINLAQTAAEQGAVMLNYINVTGLLKQAGKIAGVKAVDAETKTEHNLQAKAVINATGVFVDDILNMDQAERKPMVQPSQGIHLVVDRSFLESSHALMIPETADGRVLFAVPWQNKLLLGTTDTPLENHATEPVALDSEVRFILDTVKDYLSPAPTRNDVLSVFAGLRPLAAPEKESTATREISRDHKLLVSASGLVSITGGKWTTYRKMAQETVDAAATVAGLPAKDCHTANIPVHGCPLSETTEGSTQYGTDQWLIDQVVNEYPSRKKKISPDYPYTEAEVLWAVRFEMARTVEDILARRLRLLFLDARAAMTAAPVVARLMAEELGRDPAWQNEQVLAFEKIASHYLLTPVKEAAMKD